MYHNRKGLDAVPTTLVIVVFLLLALGVSLVVLNVGSGILTGGFESIQELRGITDDIDMGENGENGDADENGAGEEDNGDNGDDEEDDDEDNGEDEDELDVDEE